MRSEVKDDVLSIGDKVSTEEISRYVNEELIFFFTPKIQVNEKMVYIADKETDSGIVECSDRETALILAKEKRELLKVRTSKDKTLEAVKRIKEIINEAMDSIDNKDVLESLEIALEMTNKIMEGK